MEPLERLQSVHTVLQLMQEHSLCSNSSNEPTELAALSSDRFVADFFIFLGQKSANAEEMKERCSTLINRLPKVSVAFLQALVTENFTREASGSSQDGVKVPTNGSEPLLGKSTTFPSFDDKGSTMVFSSENVSGSKLLTCNNRGVSEERLLSTTMVPLVGLRAMERASSTLEDFCRSYFMFHKMDVRNPEQLFKYLPVLSFVEAFIYQLDEQNEDQVSAQNPGAVVFQNSQPDGHALVKRCIHDAAHAKTCSGQQHCNLDSSSVNGLGPEPFRRLEQALADQGLLTERITSEFNDGLKYWRLEWTLCQSVKNGAHISAEDVFTAIKLKSFDYRVLNLLLYSMTGREVNEAHYNFLAVSELLVEISDDLYDYEDDVLKNSFNVLRMLVNVYGPVKAPDMLAKLISEQEVRYQQRLDSLEPSLAELYQERCKEATREGAGNLKHQFGSWTIPPLIVDEQAFRTQVCSTRAP